MQRVIGFAVLTAAGACAPSRPPAVVAAPVDTVAAQLLPPAVDLSGSWATGSANEPPPGPVMQHPACAYNPPVWIIEQNGNALKSWAFPESFNQGIKSPGPGPERIAAVPGTISGNTVLITDGVVRLSLTYDAVSGHLRGTRNGAPFWAARQSVSPAECPGIP
ncbi:MAG TPA: hypothetical protein VFO66_11160 [Gemmatimonadaceae bacterium]|nr:hypothetical protein [Gemmatimonadaceae bacterium]